MAEDRHFLPLFTDNGQPCAGRGHDMYPKYMDSTVAERAKALCRACPVRSLCLEWALEHEEQYGVWGGTTPQERGMPGDGKARKR